MNENFIYVDADYNKILPLVDQHAVVQVENRTPNIDGIGTVVKGDTNSELITFEISRFYDGVDLIDKFVKIIYKTAKGTFQSNACNICYNDEKMRFDWLIPYNATHVKGKIFVAIEIFSEDYSLKSKMFKMTIEDSLDGTDITDKHEQNWFINIETRLNNIEQSTGLVDLTYTKLDGKPIINGVVLDGALSLDDLGIDIIRSYSALDDKPIINGKTLEGNLSLEDIGVSNKSSDVLYTNNGYENVEQVLDAFTSFINAINKIFGVSDGEQISKECFDLYIKNYLKENNVEIDKPSSDLIVSENSILTDNNGTMFSVNEDSGIVVVNDNAMVSYDQLNQLLIIE